MMRRIFTRKHRHRQHNRLTLGALMLRGSKTKQSVFTRMLPTASLLVIFLCTLVLQSLAPFLNVQSYELSDQIRTLTGESRDDTADYLKLSDDGSSYRFEVPKSNKSGQFEHTGRVADAFSASLSTDAEGGITVTEKNSQIAVTLIPEFFTQAGKKVEGDHIVYPTGPDKLVYTLKYNGLKEDIIVSEYRADELSYKFTLRLPAGVEARLDSQSNIGIYSADPALFGDISFGSDEDKEKVKQARINGEKTNLVMTIPYPIIKDATGQEYTDRASFELGEKKQEQREVSNEQRDLPEEVAAKLAQETTVNEYPLTVKTQNLKDLSYPIAIDPTMRVNDASNFAGIDPEKDVFVDTTNGYIKRSSLTGGELSWDEECPTCLPSAGGNFLKTYNGFLYFFGGAGNIWYAPINANGSIGTFIDSGQARGWSREPAIHNGYVYIVNNQTWAYATVNNDGSIGTFTNTSAYPGTDHSGFAVEAYNGYLYMSGGYRDCVFTCTTYAYTYVAEIFPDGSLGTWDRVKNGSGNNITFPQGRGLHGMKAYNGYMYLGGGYEGKNGTGKNTFYYTKILANGGFGGWVAGATTPESRTGSGFVIMDGYIYSIGAFDDSNRTFYAQINADGTFGVWHETTGFTNGGRGGAGNVGYNGRIYFSGGTSDSGTTNYSDVQIAEISPAGELASWTAGTTFNTSVNWPSAAVYNGYIYKAGGATGVSIVNNVEYAKLNADGSIGTWTATNAMNTGRLGFGLVAHKGYLYALGGCTVFVGSACTSAAKSVEAATINPSTGAVNNDWAFKFTMVRNRWSNNAVVHNGYIYAGPGCNAALTVCYSSIDRAQITTPGTLGSFTEDTTGVANGSGVLTSEIVVWNGIMYWVRGNDSTLRYITINSSTGSVSGTWSSYGTTFTAVTTMGAVVAKGVLYILGGTGSTTVQAISFDGSTGLPTGSWRTMTALPTVTESADFVASNSHIYGIEVSDTATVTDDTYYVAINNGGSGLATQEFVTNGSFTNWGAGSLGARRYDHSTAKYKGIDNVYLYASGGLGCDSICATHPIQNDIRRIVMGSNGVPVTSTGSSLPDGGYAQHELVIVDNYMFIVGGVANSGGNENNVYRETINPSTGSLSGTWTDMGPADDLPINMRSHTATVVGNKIIVTGGFDGSNVVPNTYYSSVDENGNLSGWTATTSLPQARMSHKAVAVGDMLFVSGGHDRTSNLFDDVIVADINSNGSLGSWRTVGYLPTGGRQSHIFQAANGFIYFGQGCTYIGLDRSACAGAAINDTWVASIGANGSLGAWVPTVSPNSGNQPWGRIGVSAEIIDGRLQEMGGCRDGCNGSNEGSDDGRFIGLASIPRKGQFSRYYDFEVGVRPTHLITRGLKQPGSQTVFAYINNNNTGNTWVNFGAVNDLAYTGENSQSILPGSGISLARYLKLAFVIDDSKSAVFPDAGSESYITDFDVHYTSNPGRRLRGGRTFTNGQDRGLDAPP